MAFTEENDFHSKEWLPLKGMACIKRNGFHYPEFVYVYNS